MGFLWVVCGAGRGVGKTRLANALCRVLPGAVYAKLGRHPRRPGKAGTYFRKLEDLDAFLEEELGRREHLVVESNALALRGRGDLVIYLGPLESTTSPRKDRFDLVRRAHILLEEACDPRSWRRILKKRLPDPALVTPVMEVLEGMFPRRGWKGFSARTKIWLLRDGGFVLGPGLAELMEAVESQGSLRKAAAEKGISYRHAWDLFRKAEANLGVGLLSKQTGGAGGGGSFLSPVGRRLLETYRKLQEEVEEKARLRLESLLGCPARKRAGKEAAR